MAVKDYVGQVLVAIGGLGALVNAILEFAYNKTTLETLGAFTLAFEPTYYYVLGVIGLIGALVAFYGAYKKDRNLSIVGGVLGIISICVIPVLAVIGGFLYTKPEKESK